MTTPETLPKGVGVAKFDTTKTFRNQLFSRVRVSYHHYSIKNYGEIIFSTPIQGQCSFCVLNKIQCIVIIYQQNLAKGQLF